MIRIAFLSFRHFDNDFRRYLMGAFRDCGHPCAHLLLRRGGMEIRYGRDFSKAKSVSGIPESVHQLRQFFADDRGIIVNSVGNSAPDVVLRLWMGLHDQIWVYDVFDRLLYGATHAKRLRWWLTDRAYRAIAADICVLSPELRADYPGSFHLDNASHLLPPARAKKFDGRVVVTASFDRRTDFAFLSALSRTMPDLTFDMYGSVFDGEPQTVRAIEQLTAGHANVRYHGGFEMDRIGKILDEYAVGLVPYRIDDAMTRFINPDKLFHYLCAGLEVITTPIPAVARMRSYIYEAPNAHMAADALRRIQDGERRNPGYLHNTFNWHVRAQEFLGFVSPSLEPESHRDTRLRA